MVWSVEHTDEFAEWYDGLSETQQDDVVAIGLLLIEQAGQRVQVNGLGGG